MREEVREVLGIVVREEWVKWAEEQENPKPSHLVPWSELDEANKEVDRRIGEAVVSALAMLLLPVFKNILAEDDIKQLLEQM